MDVVYIKNSSGEWIAVPAIGPESIIPPVPQEDGQYTLQAVENDGAASVEWIVPPYGDLIQPYSDTPAMDGGGSPGSSYKYARGDHSHPSDTSKVSKTGGTLTGNLSIEQPVPGYYAKSTINSASSAPDADTNSAGFRCQDKNGTNVAIFTDSYRANGRVGAQMLCSRSVNGVNEYNTIGLYIEPGGGKVVTISAPQAWRNALGISYVVNNTHTTANSQVISGFFTASATQFIGDYYAEASLDGISTVTITALTGLLRGTNGSVETTANMDFTSGDYTAAATKLSSHRIRIQITKNSAFSNATNNTPASFWGSIGLRFT